MRTGWCYRIGFGHRKVYLVSYVLDKVQSAITPKLGKAELRFLCTAHKPNEINLPTQFHDDNFYSYRVMFCSKCKNEQRGITPKMSKAELQFLSTAHLPNEIYLPKKYHVWDITCCCRVMSRTRKADNRTNKKSATICSPLGEHKICVHFLFCQNNLGHMAPKQERWFWLTYKLKSRPEVKTSPAGAKEMHGLQ
jgi:hypothetical protein